MLSANFVSVGPAYQSQGIGTALVEEMFRYCAENDYALHGSSYTDEGRQRLQHIFYRTARRYKVKYLDEEQKEVMQKAKYKQWLHQSRRLRP